MSDFHTGLFDCCKSEYTLSNGRVVKLSRLESLKAFLCPCVVLEENTRRLDLEPNTIYCQNWNCLGYFVLQTLSATLIGTTPNSGMYLGDNIIMGASALHASERDALMRKYGITSERDSAETCFKTTCCWWMALAQESREITIREQNNDPYQSPLNMEMEERLL
jgi:Cys-rich protein (TIGR01571 family)